MKNKPQQRVPPKKELVPEPEAPASSWLREADQFLFGYGSPTTLGIFRILAGLWATVNYLMILPFWRDWFYESGFVPAWIGRTFFVERTDLPSGLTHLLPHGVPRIDLLNGVTDIRIIFPFYIAVIVAGVLTCLGLGTRYAAYFLALGVITLHNRDGAILHGGDTMMRLMVIYVAVTPCGQACSLDRLIGLWRGTAPHAPPIVPIWGQRLMEFNVALVYFTSIWYKWDGEKWRTLVATYYPERLAEFYRFPVPEFLKSMWMAHITTAGTIATEFSLGTLVFFAPTRKYVLLAGVMMHAWIEYSMNIPLFSFLMISSYVVFFEGEEIIAWARRLGMRLRKLHVEVRLPEGQQFTPRGVAFFSALDPLGLVYFLPGTGTSFTAASIDRNGPLNLDRALWTRSVGGWIFLWIPGLPGRLLKACLEPVHHHQNGAMATEEVTAISRHGSLKA